MSDGPAIRSLGERLQGESVKQNNALFAGYLDDARNSFAGRTLGLKSI